MTNPKITDDEMQVTCHWLTTAQRFHSFCRGHAQKCKRRTCNSAGMCMAQGLDPAPEKNLCGVPLKKEDVTQVVQLALFGMMLEEGLLSVTEESSH